MPKVGELYTLDPLAPKIILRQCEVDIENKERKIFGPDCWSYVIPGEDWMLLLGYWKWDHCSTSPASDYFFLMNDKVWCYACGVFEEFFINREQWNKECLPKK